MGRNFPPPDHQNRCTPGVPFDFSNVYSFARYVPDSCVGSAKNLARRVHMINGTAIGGYEDGIAGVVFFKREFHDSELSEHYPRRFIDCRLCTPLRTLLHVLAMLVSKCYSEGLLLHCVALQLQGRPTSKYDTRGADRHHSQFE